MIESIWDTLLQVHSGCPGNIFFSKISICKGSRPACNNIQIHEKWEVKRQMFSRAACSLSPSAPKPLLQLQSPLPTDPNGKLQSRITFYSWFTNPLKVPDLALPLFLVHHKNKCTEKPLRSSLCWRTSFPYFFFFFLILILPLITSHEAAVLGTTARLPTGNPCYWSRTYVVGSILCKRNKW